TSRCGRSAAWAADCAGSTSCAAGFTAGRTGTRQRICRAGTSRRATAGSLAAEIGGRISGHEDRTFNAGALRSLNFRVTDVYTERSIAGGMRPYEHAVRIASVLRDVCLQPLDQRGDRLAAVVPILGRMTLHRYADHVVLHRPAPDVV